MMKPFIVLSVAAAFGSAAHAQLRITEWCYQGNSGEYVEITNITGSTIDLSGYSFDDNSRVPGSMLLSGLLAPGASAVICDALAADFRASWNIPASVIVIGGNVNNLGRADEVNIYSNTSPFPLIDRLTYDDQTLGGPRTQNFGGITQPTNWGANSVSTCSAPPSVTRTALTPALRAMWAAPALRQRPAPPRPWDSASSPARAVANAELQIQRTKRTKAGAYAPAFLRLIQRSISCNQRRRYR